MTSPKFRLTLCPGCGRLLGVNGTTCVSPLRSTVRAADDAPTDRLARKRERYQAWRTADPEGSTVRKREEWQRYVERVGRETLRDKDRQRYQRQRQRYLAKAALQAPRDRTVTSAVRTANLRAERHGAEGRITADDVLSLWQRQPACVRCGVGRGVDHVVDMSAGGPNTPSNLQNLCRLCNAEKWFQSRRSRSTVRAARDVPPPSASRPAQTADRRRPGPGPG